MMPDLSSLSDEQLANLASAGNEATTAGVDPDFAVSQEWQESHGKSTAISPVGARGPMQLMPGTAQDLGVDPNDPNANIKGGIKYDKQMMDKFKDPTIAAMAYNWGPGNVDKWIKTGSDITQIPDETLNYIANVHGKTQNTSSQDLSTMSDDDLAALESKLRPNEKQSLLGSIVGGAADVPLIKQAGAALATGANSLGIPGFENAISYSAARQNQDTLKKQGEASHPTATAAANIAANAVPYAIAPQSALAGGIISGGESLINGDTLPQAAAKTAIGAAMPFAIGKAIPAVSNVVGNVARGAGDMPGSALWRTLGLATPLSETTANISKAIHPANFDSALENTFAKNALSKENPLLVAKQIPGIGGKLSYLAENNPAWYGSLGQSILEPAKEVAELGLTSLGLPHVAAVGAGTTATQYGAGITSALAKALNASGLSQAAKDYFMTQLRDKELQRKE